MLTERSVKIESQRLRDLKLVVETYKLIAAGSMRRIRGSVVSNRDFHEGLNRIFQEVKYSYFVAGRKPAVKSEKFAVSSLTVVPRNGKIVYMLLSANTGLYGDVVDSTFRIFLDEAKRGRADLVVVGKIGKVLMESEFPKTPYIYFDFSDTAMEHDALKKIYEAVGHYEKVVAFYGLFKSLFSQMPMQTVVSGETLPAVLPDKKRLYLFEPTFEKVAFFFETEIFASLLEQIFNESRLAKLASRLLLLDRSSVRTDRESQKMFLLERMFWHRSFNRKQINALAGMALWYSD